jgi:penicillin amidase
MKRTTLVAISIVGLAVAASMLVAVQPDLTVRARTVLAQHNGSIMLTGIREPVEVLRDKWGVPHIYARNTADLFFAQGYVVAQDRMWQLEMWRRNGEGRLAEVLGPAFIQRDKFARLLAFRGDWDQEFRKYHPEGRVIFDAFARGVNASIQKSLDENRIPLEFELMGFQPQPVWTAKTVLTRMPGWTLTRNASSEVERANLIKTLGIDKVEELMPTTPYKKLEVPAGLDLNDIEPAILGLAGGANDIRWSFKADLGSNNWVIGGPKSATGMPIIANDPHREVVNPALRYLVHLNAPGWDALGATEPGLPGISIGHNERVAWGFTILGMDQQDLYVEETDPADANHYQYKGQWLSMQTDRELIHVKGKAEAEEFQVKLTRHGPVLYENKQRHRAFALRWVGAEPGGAGYLGSLNVMQSKNWKEFNEGLDKAWYIPSHSLVYADVEGNYGYVGVARTPIRKNWDGLLPVPGKDGKYEWDGYVPLDKLPHSLNRPEGYYGSANNDVVPKIVPGYNIPLGYEYSAPYRFDRIDEVLKAQKKFTLGDMEKLQEDTASLPARELVPLLREVKSDNAEVNSAKEKLLAWDFNLNKNSVPATIYEYWVLKLTPQVYAAKVKGPMPAGLRPDIRNVIRWTKSPDAERNRMVLTALEQALADLHKRMGDDMSKWQWGSIHQIDFPHPLLSAQTKPAFGVETVKRGGDAYTVMATSSPTERNTNQESGASFKFVFDVQDWDRSTGLSAPGQSGQPGSPHYADLAPLWGDGTHFPLAFSRKKVEEVTTDRLMLYPVPDNSKPGTEDQFEPVQPELFSEPGAQVLAWADYDNDGQLDLFVGFRGGMSRLYHNDHGHFKDVSAEAGLNDSDEVRSAAWGDYDADGCMDLYVGFAKTSTRPNKLYHNDCHGHFTDVAESVGIHDVGESRQVSFVDYDNDGDVDLYVAFRDQPNKLYRNDGGKFVDVAKEVGVADPRKTVGSAWFDYDKNGTLDLFVANQDGDLNGFYHNDHGHFTDIAHKLGIDGAGRPLVYGSVGVAVGDYDNDGNLDMYVANYGPSWLLRNNGDGKFVNVAPQMGVAPDRHLTVPSWGDYDNDGRLDLYIAAYLTKVANVRDYLFHNEGDHFTDVITGYMLKHDATHGVQWVDFDGDGALDLALADNGPSGVHYLYRNRLPAEKARRSIQVLVLDSKGHYTRAGSEVRLYTSGAHKLLGTRLVDTGGGYCSQNAMPVHFGVPVEAKVDIEVTSLTREGRKVTRVAQVDPRSLKGKPITIKTADP